MAGKRKRPNGWQYVVKKAGVLDKPLYLTFDSEAEGDAYIKQLERMLEQGIVPEGVQERTRAAPKSLKLAQVIREYRSLVNVARADQPTLDILVQRHGALRVGKITHDWADEWVTALKRERQLAPSTIRHYVGTLARSLDWAVRKGHLGINPLRNLRAGYSSYSPDDIAAAGVQKLEKPRDRRLDVGEEPKIIAALQSLDTPDGPDQLSLFCVAIGTGMRMSEMTTLTPDQVKLEQRLVRLIKTKNGRTRDVPLSKSVVEALRGQLERSGTYVWPWLQPYLLQKERDKPGRKDNFIEAREQVSSKQSHWWSLLFKRQGIENFTFHCLRHECTSRVFESSKLTEREIMKMFGWASWEMVDRYSHLRPSSMADKLD